MSDRPATVTVTDPATGKTTSHPLTAPSVSYTNAGGASQGVTITGGSTAGGQAGRVQVLSISDSTAQAQASDTVTGQAQTGAAAGLSQMHGREPFLYAGIGLIVLTVLVLGPLARRRPDWKVRLGLPYLVAFVLVSYALDGSWQKSLAMAGACLLIVFGITLLRLWRWRIPRKPTLHAVSLPGMEADPYVRQVMPALKELGFTPEAGYEVAKPYGSLAVLSLRHRKDPVVAQVRLTIRGARRYPHLVFATRLRGGEQIWTWNNAGILPPQPPQWTTYHHAGIQDPGELYKLHQQHLSARPAVAVADKEADVAKRIAAQTEWELQSQAEGGWLAADGERFRLTGRAIWRWTAAAFFAFLGVPFEKMKLPTR
jgi:hypothetical protein